MTRVELERAADDRLLDAVLEEVLATVPARVAVRPQRWLAAAILLLGIGVLFAVVVLTGTPGTEFAQQPELPPAIKVEGRAALARVDRKAQNLWCLLAPDDLPLLAEFGDLRQLLLEPQPPTTKPPADAPLPWSLAPLARCARLRSLAIGNLEGFEASALAAVARLPELHELKLIGTRHLVDARFAGELQKLPLRSLALWAVGIDGEGFTALCGLPLLERLELRNCLHLDRCDLTQLRHLRQLRALSLHGVGGRLADSLSKSYPLADEPRLEPPPDPPGEMRTGLRMPGEQRPLLTVAVMRALARLPELRELDLVSSVVDDAVLAALPPQLTALDVHDCTWLGTEGLAAAPALADLRSFGFTGRDGAEETAWRFVQAHRLREISLHGALTEAAVAGLMAQTELRALELVLLGQPQALDLTFAAALPRLERLSVWNVPDFDPAPLLRLPRLSRVKLHRAAPTSVARVRGALGDRVQVLAIDD